MTNIHTRKVLDIIVHELNLTADQTPQQILDHLAVLIQAKEQQQ